MGFENLHRSYSLGISARRAEWFVRRTRDTASRPVVNMDNFEEGLGRIMYVTGAVILVVFFASSSLAGVLELVGWHRFPGIFWAPSVDAGGRCR